MLRTVSRRSALVALVLASALAAPSRAGDTVPIRAVGSFTAVGQEVDPSTGNLIIFADISGNSSHLGRFTGTATEVLYAPDYVSFTVYTTQVAANGDELFATYEGSFIDADGDSVGTFEITGGTGRFAGASGSGTFVSLDDGAQVVEQGVISTVGSGR
jgi:hypothetical protein